MDRFQLLNDLVCFKKTINILSEQLTQLDWDYDGKLFVVQASHVRAVLEGFLLNKYSAKELESWANLIEGREDLDFEHGKSEEIEEAINFLANPVLQGEITCKSCEKLLEKL